MHTQLIATIIESLVRQFQQDLAAHLLSQGKVSAAHAALNAHFEPNQAEGIVCIRCESIADAIALRNEAVCLGNRAKKENIKKILIYPTPTGYPFPIIPGMGRQHCCSTWSVGMKNANVLIASPQVAIGDLNAGLSILRVLTHFLENPDTTCGLVDSEGQQLALTQTSAQMILGDRYNNMTPEERSFAVREATKLKRTDYFYLPDLEIFERTMRSLSPIEENERFHLGYANSREITWRGINRANEWIEYTHRYWAVRNGNQVLHIGQNLGFQPCTPPVLVAA